LFFDKLNSFEKNSFLKIIDDIIISNPRNIKGFDKIFSDKNRDLKSIDSINIAKVFQLLQEDFTTYLASEFISTTSQLDILVDIISRDGNCIMSQDWFSRLYEREIKNIRGKVKELQKSFEGERSAVKDERKRDYSIYKACLSTAYINDDKVNLERKITNDEQSILLTLANQLELSQEEIKLINYSIVPIQKQSIDEVINDLKKSGVIFYSKKLNTVYVADEIVRILRKLRGKEVADKFFRRVLRLLRDPQINLVCRKHNIDWRLPYDEKVKEIINEGISFRGVLVNDMHKEGTNVTMDLQQKTGQIVKLLFYKHYSFYQKLPEYNTQEPSAFFYDYTRLL